MPSVLYLLEHPELDDVYIVPPIRYPDGKWYIKIGGSRKHAPVLDDVDSMNRSMRNQSMRNRSMQNPSMQNRARRDRSPDSDAGDDQLPALREVLQDVLPDVRFDAWRSKPCLITDTASGLPYVDRVENGVWVAFGGNGHAAKSSDALGALAARFALEGRWTDAELAAGDFAARIGTYVPPAGSRHGN
jgi:sarcosine oxidase